MTSFLDRPLEQIPLLIVDLETTGIIPGRDRVVEIAAVSLVPGGPPKVVLDTVVDPGVEVGWSELHGLKQADVEGAPFLPEVGKALRPLLANRVLVCHNLEFDRGFLCREQILYEEPPGLCTLELFRTLFQDKRSLDRACAYVGVPHENAHSARGDALATALLARRLLNLCREADIRTFRQLIDTHESFRPALDHHMLPAPASLVTQDHIGAKPRTARKKAPPLSAARQYLDAVVLVLSDLLVEPKELRYLHDLRADLGLPPSRQRAVHAKVFNAFLTRYSEDQELDLREAGHLATVHRCLRELGWAPGGEVGY